MTTNERFEEWWASFTYGLEPNDAIAGLIAKAAARAAWHAAAMSDEDRETCIEALESEIQDANERLGRYMDRIPSRANRARADIERFAAVRRRLEGK